jgi:CHRD domain
LEKIFLPLLLLATLGILAALPHMASAHDHEQSDDNHALSQHVTIAVFHVRLEGEQQVPSVNTSAFGFLTLRLFVNGTSSAIDFRLIVCNIANVTHAHIHFGATGTNGPGGNNIVIPFFDITTGENPVSSTHGCTVLAHGLRGPTDLIPRPDMGISNWTDFVHALLSGNTYVNVHTTAHGSGEIRAQIASEEEHGNDQGDDN